MQIPLIFTNRKLNYREKLIILNLLFLLPGKEYSFILYILTSVRMFFAAPPEKNVSGTFKAGLLVCSSIASRYDFSKST
jgi:hypothetical protein